jgi:SAM-dependent methyltransferase
MGAEEIFAAMRHSGMADWVGGGDPAAVGTGNFTSIMENLPLRPEHAVLDFGCGIGRTSVRLAEFLNEGGRIVGSDIVPGQIQFCRDHITPSFPNATFYCVRASNPSYDNLVATTASAAPMIDEESFFLKYREAFNLVVAFSVFTHFDPTMAAHYLGSLRDVTKLWGRLFLTWYLDHPGNPPECRLGPDQNFKDLDGKLGLALFSPAGVAGLAADASLLIERICYGSWRLWPPPYLKGGHYQDIVILRSGMPREFDPKTYLAIHKDVADAGIDPVQHYLFYGREEGRRIK